MKKILRDLTVVIVIVFVIFMCWTAVILFIGSTFDLGPKISIPMLAETELPEIIEIDDYYYFERKSTLNWHINRIENGVIFVSDSNITEGRLFLSHNKGAADIYGNIIVPAVNRSVGFRADGTLAAESYHSHNGSTYRVFDLTGKLIFEANYRPPEPEKEMEEDEEETAEEERAVRGEAYGLINKNGNVLIPFQYDDIWHCKGDLWYARFDKNVVIYNIRTGQVIVLEYLNMERVNFYDGYIVMYEADKRDTLSVKSVYAVKEKN